MCVMNGLWAPTMNVFQGCAAYRKPKQQQKNCIYNCVESIWRRASCSWFFCFFFFLNCLDQFNCICAIDTTFGKWYNMIASWIDWHNRNSSFFYFVIVTHILLTQPNRHCWPKNATICKSWESERCSRWQRSIRKFIDDKSYIFCKLFILYRSISSTYVDQRAQIAPRPFNSFICVSVCARVQNVFVNHLYLNGVVNAWTELYNKITCCPSSIDDVIHIRAEHSGYFIKRRNNMWTPRKKERNKNKW